MLQPVSSREKSLCTLASRVLTPRHPGYAQRAAGGAPTHCPTQPPGPCSGQAPKGSEAGQAMGVTALPWGTLWMAQGAWLNDAFLQSPLSQSVSLGAGSPTVPRGQGRHNGPRASSSHHGPRRGCAEGKIRTTHSKPLLTASFGPSSLQPQLCEEKPTHWAAFAASCLCPAARAPGWGWAGQREPHGRAGSQPGLRPVAALWGCRRGSGQFLGA